QQLLRDSCAAAAKRQTDRQFGAARREAGQQQSTEIDAGEKEQETGQSKNERQCRRVSRAIGRWTAPYRTIPVSASRPTGQRLRAGWTLRVPTPSGTQASAR